MLDQIFILKQILEKRWGVDQDEHALFVDFKAAYDFVDKNCLWKIMIELGVPGKLVRLTKACTNDPKCRVLIQGEVSEGIKS